MMNRSPAPAPLQNRILVGDARRALDQVPANSVHCVVTSPPYLGLRDPGLAPLVWGGRAECVHTWGPELRSRQRNRNKLKSTTLRGSNGDGAHEAWTQGTGVLNPSMGMFCDRCPAWLGHLGAEPTQGLYIQHLVEILAKVRRVLRDDGTLWLNIGDGYSTGAPMVSGGLAGIAPLEGASFLPPKNLRLTPSRVAIALQDNGWCLRSDIIWSKKNPMPESVKDRPAKTYEHVFLFSKGPHPYYDHEDARALGRNEDVWEIALHPFKGAHFATYPLELVRPIISIGTSKFACRICGTPWRRVAGNGWSPNAKDKHRDPTRSTVLDPFMGSGTTAVAAEALGRDYIGCELNPEYAALASRRIESARGTNRR